MNYTFMKYGKETPFNRLMDLTAGKITYINKRFINGMAH